MVLRIKKHNSKKRIARFGWLLVAVMLIWSMECRIVRAEGQELNIQAESAVLMEATTGTVLYAQNENARLSPASITKIMTLYLVFEAIEKGELSMEEFVPTSEYASSMGGSQVFLEAGEEQSVDTLIKCIIIASGNDASVVMAERISGTEAAFVDRMNDKAMEFGLENTHFMDCCGLSMSDEHYTSALDVAIMSRRLITDYPMVLDYSGIWMEDITHNTRRGETPFTLSSTNKLLKQYKWATGLKTGSTSKAKFCLSATANKDGLKLIAVVMACPDPKGRFKAAASLLDYGYNTCRVYEDSDYTIEERIPVAKSLGKTVAVKPEKAFYMVDCERRDFASVERKLVFREAVEAPVREGDVLGTLIYSIGEEELGRINIVACEAVSECGLGEILGHVIKKFLF